MVERESTLQNKENQIKLWPLVTTIFFIVSGGAYGIEDLISGSGPGMAILLILIVPLVWAVPVALMTAELASAIPSVGGYYLWVKKGLGPFWGFQAGWWTWLYSLVDNALYPVLFVEYLSNLLKIFNISFFDQFPFLKWCISLMSIWPFVVLNIRGTKTVGDSSIIFSFLVLIPFVLFSVIGIGKGLIDGFSVDLPLIPPNTSLMGACGLGLCVAMWNSMGWDGISTLGDEVENPQKTYPKALIRALGLVIISYLIPIVAGLMFNGSAWQEWKIGYFTTLAYQMGGKWLAILITLGAVFSALGQFNANLLTTSRIPFVLSHDGFMPESFRKVHPKFGTPVLSIVASAIIYSILCVFSFEDLIVVDILLYAGALILKFLSLIFLRIKYPNLERPYLIPGGWIGIIFMTLAPILILFLSIAGLCAGESFQTLLLGGILLGTGPLLYKPLKALYGN